MVDKVKGGVKRGCVHFYTPSSILLFQKNKRGLWHTPKQSDRQYYKMQESINKLFIGPRKRKFAWLHLSF